MNGLAKIFILYLSYRLDEISTIDFVSKTSMYNNQTSIYMIERCLHQYTKRIYFLVPSALIVKWLSCSSII